MLNLPFLLKSLAANPEFVIRYYSVYKHLKHGGLSDNYTVLDVGGGDMNIGNLINNKTTVLDVEIRFSKFKRENVKVVIGSVTKIPFEDNFFNSVVSVDMLEHIAKRDREKAIQEMVRVTNRLLCISFPSGKESLNQDKQLQSIYKSTTGIDHVYFTEHSEYGLPDITGVLSSIEIYSKLYNKKIEIIRVGQNFNRFLRKIYMYLWITDFTPKKILFRTFGLLCFCLNFNKKGYRKTIFIRYANQ